MAVRIFLYGHDGCPGTRSALDYLWQGSHPFQYRNVATDPDARAEMAALGGFATPLIAVGDRLFLGFDPLELEQALRSEEVGRGGQTEPLGSHQCNG